MDKIELPEDVKYILETLNENGYSSYIVGGCVRDSLMGIEPKDWDITTNATPSEVRDIFEEEDILVVPTGEKYGTMTLVIDEESYEVTTFRYDCGYVNGRRPESVRFGNSIRDDLARRDLTINAMCYNELVGIVDLYDGIGDITNKRIRFVGNAEERIKEDALRILRAVRFSVRFGFDIDVDTLQVLRDNVILLDKISRERIRQELVQILSYPITEKLYDKIDFIFAYIFNSQKIDRKNNITNPLIKELVKRIVVNEQDYQVKLAKIFYLLFDSLYLVEEWLRENKYSYQEIATILNCMKIKKIHKQHLSGRITFTDYEIRKLLSEFPYEDLRLYFYDDEEMWGRIVKNLQEPLTLQELELDGNDLKFLGYQGKEIGEILNYLLDKVLEEPELNNKETLLKLVKERK